MPRLNAELAFSFDHLHRQSLLGLRTKLHSLFAEYGAVKKCSLPLDRETGRKRGFGFVDMVSEADEQKAGDDLQTSSGWGATSA